MSLPILKHNITPEQAFGSASSLVTNSNAVANELPNDGALFQIAVLVIGFVYIFFIVRYWSFLRYFIIGAIGIHQDSDNKAHINPAEKTNIEIVMIILGVITLALCLLRGFNVWHLDVLTGISLQGIIPISIAAIVSLFIYQYGTIFLCSTVCERGDVGRALIGIKSLYLAVTFVTTIPFAIVFLLWQSAPPLFAIIGCGLSALVALIIFVKETFLFFVGQKISILHWFLYLCALEIFPLSLILAPFLR